MSEVLDAPPPVATFNPFDETSWKETVANGLPSNEPPVAPPVQDTPPVVEPPSNEEIFDEAQYLKTKFGHEKPDDLLKELTELREAKAKTFEFANEDSRRLFDYIKENKEEDLYNVLDQKRRVDKLLKADLSDKNSAAELIKLNYKFENKDLTDDEVNFLFKKRFGIPSKPVMDSVNDSEDDYQLKVNAWEEIVKEKEMEMSIEAKVAKPKLEKYKTELVLPDIQKPAPVQSNEPSQEELAKIQEARGRYLSQLDETFKSFNGFDMTYKSEAGDVPISFNLNEQEKGVYKTELSDFELGKFMDERWFNNNGDFNVRALAEDLFVLKNRDKLFQKAASEGYAKGFANYLKGKSNITIQNPQQTFNPDTPQNDREKQIGYIWENS